MAADKNDRDRLARIEADLNTNDPEFSRRFAAGQDLLPAAPPTWLALFNSGLRLAGATAVFVAALRWSQPLLLIPAIGLFLIVLRPVVRKTRGAATAAPGRLSPSFDLSARSGARQMGVRSRRAPAAPAHANSAPPVGIEHAVVVGCDGDPSSDGALRFAAVEAGLRSARLIVVTTVCKPIDPDVDDFETPESDLQARARTRTEDALRRALGRRLADLPPHAIVTECGNASRVLLNEFGDAELLVVGTHQRHMLSRLLHMQSTSADLIHHGHVPVVVVPPTWTPRRTAPWAS